VRFVATATIGFDHVDVNYLERRAIGFASAPGSNANSVAEYVVAALLVLAQRKGWTLERRTLGVIGVGNVGSRVVAKAEALGLKVLQNDPPLARQTGEARFRPIEELLGADILSLHVPLTLGGEDRTFHMIDEPFLARLKKGATLLNTSRGPVVDGSALLNAIDARWLGGAVLDVWEREPDISTELLERVDLGTSHIAGYSFDGKVAGTLMVYRAACKFFRGEATWRPEQCLPPPKLPLLDVHAHGRSEEGALLDAVKAVYDVEADDAALRELITLPAEHRGPHFDQLRKTYPTRREFFNTEVHLVHGSDALMRKLEGVGFRVRAGHPG